METVYSMERPKFGIMKQTLLTKCLILYTKPVQSELKMYYFNVFFFIFSKRDDIFNRKL